MATRRTRAEYDELHRKEARRKDTVEGLEKKRDDLRIREEELEAKMDGDLPKGTTIWNAKGEQVSTFEIEDGTMWLIIERVGEYTVLHVFQTERVCFVKLFDTIRRDKLKEAVILRIEDKRFILEQISWEEIAKRAIRQGQN